jgi:hypothetical protein
MPIHLTLDPLVSIPNLIYITPVAQPCDDQSRHYRLDTHSYRAKYGIPRTQPLAAKTTTARRREVAQETRPWEKTSTFLKGQAHNGHAAPEPEAKVQRDEAKEPTATASAQPKRQGKTTPKKTARKQTSAG